MPDSEAKKRWDRENTKQFKMRLNLRTDSDIIQRLENQESVQGYIKRLIREDMKKGGAKTMITYKINPEFIDLWGDEANSETTLTANDIEMIASGWEKPVDEIIDQLEPVNYEAAVALMDDDLREEINADLAPCTEARFLWEYCKRHQDKYEESFSI